MTSGPEHYLQAQLDMQTANERPLDGEAFFYLRRAQIHALLALTAATVEAGGKASRWPPLTTPAMSETTPTPEE